MDRGGELIAGRFELYDLIGRGGSAATLLGDHGALPDDYVAGLVDQLLDALTAVHAVGVVRHLKPANVLLEVTGSGRHVAWLSDFGIAAVVDEPRPTQAASSLGTLGYMAPEQAAGAEAHWARTVGGDS